MTPNLGSKSIKNPSTHVSGQTYLDPIVGGRVYPPPYPQQRYVFPHVGLAGWLGWLVGWVGWVGWSVGWLVGWLADWLVAWKVDGCKVDGLVAW